MMKSENETSPAPLSGVVAAYEAETAVDQSIPIRRRMEAFGSLVVTAGNIEDARRNRTALNNLLKDAAAPRLRVQRAIKAHPIGAWAFTKSDLEREIEQKSAHLKMEIEAHTRDAEAAKFASERKDWVIIVRDVDLATINRLVGVTLLGMGILAENHGPSEGNETRIEIKEN